MLTNRKINDALIKLENHYVEKNNQLENEYKEKNNKLETLFKERNNQLENDYTEKNNKLECDFVNKNINLDNTYNNQSATLEQEFKLKISDLLIQFNNRVKHIESQLTENFNNKLYEKTNEIILKFKEEQSKYEIIIKNNYQIIKELKEYFKNINTIIINGKGKSVKYNHNAIGINQSIIFSNKDFMFFNDFPSLFGVEEYLKNVKYVFCPDYPHDGNQAIEKLTYINVLSYLTKYGFTGKIFIYQIQTSLSSYKMNDFTFTSYTTTDIPIQIFSKFLNKKHFNLFGIGKDKLYHPDLLDLNLKYIMVDEEYIDIFNKWNNLHMSNFNEKLSSYNEQRINNLLNYFTELQNKLNININFN